MSARNELSTKNKWWIERYRYLELIKNLEMLDNMVREGTNTLLEAYNIFPDSNDQKE